MHVKWLIAVDDRRKALEYAEREEMREGWDYCDVEFVGYVDELLSNRERRAHVERMLRLEGLDPQELASILEKAREKGKKMIFLVDCHI
jgi:DNA-directed RNA polymerase subunit F